MLTQNMFWQLCRFGIVGVSAAAVNFLMVVIIVENAQWDPLLANIVAFLLAFIVSYIGHRFWTFNHKTHKKSSLTKFLIVAVNSFICNEGLFAILLHTTSVHYTTALIITIFVVAIITFIFSKLWAFK